jgi:hypothetical protein
MATMVGMSDDLLARFHANQADFRVIIGPDYFMIPLFVIKLLDFLHVKNL